MIRKKITFVDNTIITKIDWIKFNANQKIVVERIFAIVIKNEFSLNYLFFFDNSSDIDKIFVQNIIVIKFQSKEQYIVLVIIFLTIVVTFFDNNYVVYLRFKILLNFDNINLYNIKKDLQRKKLLKETCLIFWDKTSI